MSIVVSDPDQDLPDSAATLARYVDTGAFAAALNTSAMIGLANSVDSKYASLMASISPVLESFATDWLPPPIALLEPGLFDQSDMAARLSTQLIELPPSLSDTFRAVLDNQVRLSTAAIRDNVVELLPSLNGALAASLFPDMASFAAAATVTEFNWAASETQRSWANRPGVLSEPKFPTTLQSNGDPPAPGAGVDALLSSVRADLISKRAGMWWALRNSPDPVCQAATSAVELVDHLLAGLASDAQVIAVGVVHERREHYLAVRHNNLVPTSAGRARVAMFNLGRDVTAQESAATSIRIRRALVEMKHHSHKFATIDTERALHELDRLLTMLAGEL